VRGWGWEIGDDSEDELQPEAAAFDHYLGDGNQEWEEIKCVEYLFIWIRQNECIQIW